MVPCIHTLYMHAELCIYIRSSTYTYVRNVHLKQCTYYAAVSFFSFDVVNFNNMLYAKLNRIHLGRWVGEAVEGSGEGGGWSGRVEVDIKCVSVPPCAPMPRLSSQNLDFNRLHDAVIDWYIIMYNNI